MINIYNTYKNPKEYLPKTFGVVIHFITNENGMGVYEFDFLDSQGKSLWNYVSKHKDYHDLMKHVIEIRKQGRTDLVILFLNEH